MPTRKKPVVAALMARIGKGTKQDANKALAEMVTLGPDAAPAASALRPLVNEPARGLGARAVLAAIGEDTATHVAVLLERAAVGKATEATSARAWLRDLPIGALSDGLARGFQHDDPEIRARAVLLAGGTAPLREAITVDEVIELLRDADPKVREAAMQAIHQHLAPNPISRAKERLTPARRKAIEPLLRDPDRKVVAQVKRLWDKLGLK